MRYMRILFLLLLGVALVACSNTPSKLPSEMSEALHAGMGALMGDPADMSRSAGIGAVADTMEVYTWDNLIAKIKQARKNDEVTAIAMPDHSLMVTLSESNVFGEGDRQSELSKENHPALDVIVDELQQSPLLRMKIVGHIDDTGDAVDNQTLSLTRAKAVAQYVIDKGVEASRIAAEGRGVNDPVASNATEQGREKNRRIEVFLYAVK